MNSQRANRIVCKTLAGCVLLASAACTTRQDSGAGTSAPRSEASTPGLRRLVQFSFGDKAAFGVCVEPACPVVTPKTLSTAVTQPMQAVTHRESPPQTPPLIPAIPAAIEPFQAPAPGSSATAAPARQVAAIDARVAKVVVTFPFASAELTASARAALSGSMHHARRADRIVIAGRTDAVGSDQINQVIALARAMVVRHHMLDLAPDLPAAISINAKGGCCFVAANDTEGGRSMNRRVEIAFFADGGV